MKNKTLIFLVVIFFIPSCGRYIYRAKQNSYVKKIKEYRMSNGFIEAKSDTLINNKNEELHYKEGFLCEAGKIKNNKRYGKWYIFSDSAAFKYVVKYKSGSVDTLFKPFAVINESW